MRVFMDYLNTTIKTSLHIFATSTVGWDDDGNHYRDDNKQRKDNESANPEKVNIGPHTYVNLLRTSNRGSGALL